MRLTYDEVLKRSEHLHKEIMGSVPLEVLKTTNAERCFDVKLIINGVECEPIYLNSIWKKIEEYVDREANIKANEKVKEALDKIYIINDIIKDASTKIMEKFDLDIENYEGLNR